jgi:hypothetical protein
MSEMRWCGRKTSTGVVGRTERNHGMPAERLFQNGRHIRQLRAVAKIGKSVFAYHRVDFRLRFALHLRIEGHREEERVEHRHSLV